MRFSGCDGGLVASGLWLWVCMLAFTSINVPRRLVAALWAVFFGGFGVQKLWRLVASSPLSAWGLLAHRQPYSCQPDRNPFRSLYRNPYKNLCRQPYSPIETLVASRKALRKPLTCAGCGAGASVTLPPPSCFGGLTKVSFIRGLRFLKATFSAVSGI